VADGGEVEVEEVVLGIVFSLRSIHWERERREVPRAAMASTAGLVPITRAFLSKFYDNYPFKPLVADVSLLATACKEQALRIHAANSDDPGSPLHMPEFPPFFFGWQTD
jgi:hypothetical protein